MGVDVIGPHIIHQTTSRVEDRLTHWIAWLRSDRNLALGDSPRPVYELEQELKRLTRDVERLRFQFDYDDDMDSFAAYEAAAETLNDAFDLIRCIRERDRGSTTYTRQALRLLIKCSHQIKEMAEQAVAAMA